MTSDQQIPDPKDDRDHQTEAAEPEAGRAGTRPFGFWLKLVDRRLSEEMDALFAEDGLTRRDWRLLNLLAGEANDEHLAAKLQAKPDLAHHLAECGWVEGTPPTLTAAGRAGLERLTEQVSALRARVAGAVTPEDFATTLATLEAVARELGWDESQPMPRGHRGGRGFGRRHRGFGRFGEHGHGGPFGHRAPFDRDEHCDDREHRGHPGHPGHPGHGGHGEHGERSHGKRHHGHGERHHGQAGEAYGEHSSPGAHFGRRGFDPRDRFAGHGHGDPREHGRFGGRRGPRQDVHVHVHLHDGTRRPAPDA